MAQTPETGARQRQSAEQRLAATLKRVPGPSADALHEVRVGRNIAAGVLATLEAADLKIGSVAHHTEQQVAGVMGDYTKNVDRPFQSMDHPSVTSYETGATLMEGTGIEANAIGHVAYSYATLTETGFQGEGGIDRAVLATADRLLDRAATDASLREGLEIIAVSAMRDQLRRETVQMADSLSLKGDPIHDVAHRAHGVVSQLAEGAGIPEHIMAEIGHALNLGEKFVASAVPGGTYAEGQVRKVLSALKDNPTHTLNYLNGVVADYLGAGPEIAMPTIDGVLYGMGLSSEFGIPKGINRDQLALAIATRMVLRDFTRVFGKDAASANVNEQRLGELVGLTAVFDYHQADGLSLVRKADEAARTQTASRRPQAE